MKRKDAVADEVKAVTRDEIEGLIARVKHSGLSEKDQRLIISFISSVLTLKLMVEKRTVGLKSLVRKMFGSKTEQRRDPKDPPEDFSGGPSSGSGSSGSESKPEKRKGGKGRHGRGDYPGAKRIQVEHESLKALDPCPACYEGKLQEGEDGVAYRWSGSLPLELTIFDLERLICSTCKTTFTANVPGEEVKPSALAADDKFFRPEERKAEPSALASLAVLRFEYGVPHYRLADIQQSQGVPLPSSTQVAMMEPLRMPAEAVFGVLEREAGQGNLVLNDDTSKRVLDAERGVVKRVEQPSQAKPLLRPKVQKKKGQKTVTSAVVSRLGEKTVCLHYTGFSTAGVNLAKSLKHRGEGIGPPLQMCDGLDANEPKGHKTILGNCLDHARRKFYDLEGYYGEVETEVLSRLGKVYANDKEAKRKGLDDSERLFWHQLYSAPLMGEIFLWLKKVKKGEDFEPNSVLMGAVQYMLKRWDELTLFLREPGVPLSSGEVERLIKRAIRHRKNSLQYKTFHGARFGDLMMSLIQTCRYAKESAHAYLTALVKHTQAVTSNPENWLPWNYRETLQALAPA